ncbi:NAD(P)-binding protein [Cylindrobasidium torrendii FP15055 ss-10]|uniref:NAD(P)-binding protein n=1 Tax=Cylindrobasidium torrendii FP15055 ss-10 TaxID=1314674 RepID=A0A0D7BDU7_9AGAR|nr:NAD(P)-binding protein [Cylindrobasidium torrendii FP15055 ss-10]
MSLSESPRVWLITGSNSGLGLTLAESALAHGDKVIATARDLKKIPESLAAAKPIRLDLDASDEEIAKVAQEALKIYGRIDILVNNAGTGLPGTVEHMTDAQLKQTYQTNVFGPLSLTRALIPSFRAQKSGAIVSISSQGAITSWPGFSAYCSSKVALDYFMEGLGHEMSPFGVSVLIIQPGFIITDWWAKAAAVQNSAVSEVYPHIGGLESTMEWAVGTGCVSDARKTIERIYEFVTETGEAGKLRAEGASKLPLGNDCSGIYKNRIEQMQKTVDVCAPITGSVNLTDEQLAEVRKSRGAA